MAAYGVSLTKEDIIRPYDKAIGTDGSIAILRGNLAPEGAVIKHTACPKEMFKAVLNARPFDSEEECLDAVLKHKVQKATRCSSATRAPRQRNARRCSIPPRPSAAIRSWAAALPSSPTAGFPARPLVRSSATAARGCGRRSHRTGEEGDLIEIDVMERKLNIIGIHGERKTMEEIDEILKERRKNWKPREKKYQKGVLRLFSEHAASPMKGAYLEF